MSNELYLLIAFLIILPFFWVKEVRPCIRAYKVSGRIPEEQRLKFLVRGCILLFVVIVVLCSAYKAVIDLS